MSAVSPVRPRTSFLIEDILRDTHDSNKVPADTPAVVTTGFPRYCFPPAGYGSSCGGSDEDSADEKDTTCVPDQTHAALDQRKTRPSFALHKVARLKSIFAQQNYLSKQERRQLAIELDMTDEQVKTWFQNKRTKLKKKMAQCDEHYAKLLYLNDLISGKASDHHHDYQASLAPPSYHGYPVEYPSLGRLPRSPEFNERLESRSFSYLPKWHSKDSRLKCSSTNNGFQRRRGKLRHVITTINRLTVSFTICTDTKDFSWAGRKLRGYHNGTSGTRG